MRTSDGAEGIEGARVAHHRGHPRVAPKARLRAAALLVGCHYIGAPPRAAFAPTRGVTVGGTWSTRAVSVICRLAWKSELVTRSGMGAGAVTVIKTSKESPRARVAKASHSAHHSARRTYMRGGWRAALRLPLRGTYIRPTPAVARASSLTTAFPLPRICAHPRRHAPRGSAIAPLRCPKCPFALYCRERKEDLLMKQGAPPDALWRGGSIRIQSECNQNTRRWVASSSTA